MKRIAGARIEVLTFKEGLLSKVAHDLLLRFERVQASTDGRRIEVEIDPGSLRVEGTMRRGVLDPGGVSEADKQEILRNVRREVLRTDEHPEAAFRGEARAAAGGHRVTGSLAIAGRTRPIAFDVREQGGYWRGEVELRPSDWSIEPFKALLGAIKLKDRVVVRFEVPVVPL